MASKPGTRRKEAAQLLLELNVVVEAGRLFHSHVQLVQDGPRLDCTRFEVGQQELVTANNVIIAR